MSFQIKNIRPTIKLYIDTIMFENVTPRPDDPIMAIMKQCKSDPRAHKIDLGVGVYKDDNGHTTILNSVKLAEKICNEE